MVSTLKLATADDIQDLLPLMENFHRSTQYASLTFDREGLQQKLGTMVDPKNDLCTVILTVKDNSPVGFLIAIAQPLLFSKDYVAVELGWWVEPDYRNSRRAIELHDAFAYWAELKGCRAASMSTIDGEFSAPLEKFYTRKDYKKAETSFLRYI